MSKKVMFIVAIVLAFAVQSMAQSDDGWIKLGEKNVAFKADKDKITLTGKEKKVTKIKITCVQGAVKIKKIHVKMSDGSTKDYDPTAGVLNKGMSTMGFDLPGKDNELKDLELEYDSMGTIVTNKRAKVEIWGKKIKDKDKD
ncbi:hypothetical protein SLH46_01860 [Draconibacterium sp. IB214405]|uniref:hypothetical protein n=1 Tax=Draconibacterium sp. IB214405 TaxID=3097352 RepID=UPI002A146A01|nr:hypothetical protein [Draconibacterium sp. IB214405]MDX8337908.1 hypothetical protein [Draconibacterium sp. IB214405]